MNNGVKIPATSDGEQGVPILRVHNITEDGRLSNDKIQHKKADKQTLHRYRLAAGDIGVNRVNSKRLIGKKCLLV